MHPRFWINLRPADIRHVKIIHKTQCVLKHGWRWRIEGISGVEWKLTHAIHFIEPDRLPVDPCLENYLRAALINDFVACKNRNKNFHITAVPRIGWNCDRQITGVGIFERLKFKDARRQNVLTNRDCQQRAAGRRDGDWAADRQAGCPDFEDAIAALRDWLGGCSAIKECLILRECSGRPVHNVAETFVDRWKINPVGSGKCSFNLDINVEQY